MLTNERNTRGLRDSLAVRFPGKIIDNALLTFTPSDYNWTAGLALPGLSTMLISKEGEHCLAGLARQGHASPSLTTFIIGPRIHLPTVRGSFC
jgi:hypothetical protein